jgi:hypothetical protein
LHAIRAVHSYWTLVNLQGAPTAEDQLTTWSWRRRMVVDTASVRTAHSGVICTRKSDWIDLLIVAHDWTRRRALRATAPRGDPRVWSHSEDPDGWNGRELWYVGRGGSDHDKRMWADLIALVHRWPDDKYPPSAQVRDAMARLLSSSLSPISK